VSLPRPFPGLVIRYNYLWADDAAKGLEEGDKDRPAAIVMAVERSSGEELRVFVLPITHSPPQAATEALEIPVAVCRAAGLDAARSWVVLSEFNEFVWPGFDLRIIPGRNPRTMAYGFLSSGFFSKMRDCWLALDAAGKSRSTARDA
jgi:hypothetical protein